MSEEEKTHDDLPDEKEVKKVYPARGKDGGVSGGVYGLAFIGAAVYFIQHADSFWAGVLGFIKALIWPAILIYNVLEHLKM